MRTRGTGLAPAIPVDHPLAVSDLRASPSSPWRRGLQADPVADDLAHQQSHTFVSVQAYVPVAFDVEHEVIGVWSPVPDDGVVAIIGPYRPQGVPFLLYG